MRLLIAGCGDLGRRLGLLWQRAGGSVVALRRKVGALTSAFDTLAIDLSKPIPAGAIRGHFDAVAFLASADRRDEAAYRAIYIDGQQHLLDAIAAEGAGPWLQRWLLVSSTAVYGENAGGWVNEDSPTESERFNGKLLREAELQLLQRLPSACCARLSGIYGPGRESLLRRAAEGETGDPRWTNRIHADDAAAALCHLLQLPQRPARICVSDDAPAPLNEVLATLRQIQGLPPDAHTATGDRTQAEGRRVDNRALRALGVRLHYPDYRAGYTAIWANRQPAAALI